MDLTEANSDEQNVPEDHMDISSIDGNQIPQIETSDEDMDITNEETTQQHQLDSTKKEKRNKSKLVYYYALSFSVVLLDFL